MLSVAQRWLSVAALLAVAAVAACRPALEPPAAGSGQEPVAGAETLTLAVRGMT